MLRSLLCRVLGVSTGLSALCACERSPTAALPKLPPDAPNVLLITLDTTRADRLGCYGYAAAQTPTLDALASDGVRFEHAFCHVPLTLASHASLLTGMYPPTTGLRSNAAGVLPTSLPTLPEAFRARGYRTGAFIGAWVLNSAFGLARGFDHYDDKMGGDSPSSPVQERPANQVCDAALAWLNEQPDRPFLAWVHFFDPHYPYSPPEPIRSQLANPYDGEIAFMDLQIKRLADWLDAHHCRHRTLVVVAGDHGEAFNEHREVQHGFFLYDVTVRVPLLYTWPGRLPPGKVVAGNVGLVDVVPTVLDLLGWTRAPSIQGESLRAAFESETFASRAVYSESDYPRMAFGWAALRSYTTEQWRYIEAPRPELYDRAADPTEDNNVIEQHRDVANQLQGALEEAVAGMPEHEAAGVTLDDRAIQALASLGYVGVGSAASRTSASARDPKDMIMVYRGTLAAQQMALAQRYAEVIQIMEPMVQQSPESDELYALLGEAYLKLGRFEQAATAYRASVRAVPNQPYRLCQLGDALAGLGKSDEALGCYEKALAAYADYGLAHNRLGLAYVRKQKFAQAEEHFRRCVQLDPAAPSALADLGLVLFQTKRLDEATTVLRQALEHDPNHEPTHRLLWQVLATHQRPAEAIAALRAASKVLPNDLGLRRALATLLAGTARTNPGAAQEALEIAGACRDQEPSNPENYDVLGMACAAAGDFASAVQAARQALALAQSQNRADLIGQIAPRLQAYEARIPR